MRNILVIEDETKVAMAIKMSLEEEGYSATLAMSGEEGFYLVTTQCFDVVILDLMLPGRNGIEILQSLRRRDEATLVLILTACDAIEQRIAGLDSGADDYMVKPFAISELLARIRVLLRRERNIDSFQLQVEGFDVNLVTRVVTRDGENIDLTMKEFDLLVYLLHHQGRFVTREMIARDVWKQAIRATPLDNVIDVHIARLRKKIDKNTPESLIHTIRGIGFTIRSGEF